MPKVEPAEHHARREIYQCLAGVGGRDNIAVPATILVEVDFQLRPNLLQDPVLERVVPEEIVSDEVRVSGGQAVPQGPLGVEILIALPVGNGGRDYRVKRPFLILSGGKTHLVKGSQDVVSVLLVSRGDSIFHQELPVAESIVRGIRVVHDVGRHGEDDLDVLCWDDFESLAYAVVIGSDAAIVSLPLNVVAKFLFEPRSGRVERSDPVRLFGLRFRHHAEPIGKEFVLRRGQRRRKTENKCGEKHSDTAQESLQQVIELKNYEVYIKYCYDS